MEKSVCKAAIMLMQNAQEQLTKPETGQILVQTVSRNYKEYTKKEVLQAKEARRAEAMIGNPS